jgi:tRNA A-37 threonylcarbamoyl transferase component Bud32
MSSQEELEFELESNKCFIKHNVESHEYKMHNLVYNMGIVNVPKIYKYDKKNKILYMQKLHNMSVSDYYGENNADISSELFENIRNIIALLHEKNIIYPDITGYNFVKYNSKLWIIDFEHANHALSLKENDENKIFVETFLNGLNEWNPNFR